MVLPEEIGDAAQNAERDRVIAWLDAGGSINDFDEFGFTLLHCCACGNMEHRTLGDGHVALARHLIALGADVTLVRKHGTFKKYARSFHRDVLTVRGLAQRGKLSTEDSVLNFLARRTDNGVVWHVLEYWRATN